MENKGNKMNIPQIETLHRTNIAERCFMKNHPDLYEYIVSMYTMNIDWKEKLYLFYHNMDEPPRCPICGGYSKFITFFKGYHTHCSVKCSGRSTERLDKIHNTIKERYGVEHALQSIEIQDKYKSTCMERYGVENKSHTQEYKDKFTKTMMDKYGGIGNSSKVICSRVKTTRRNNRLLKSVIPNQIGYSDDGLWVMKCECPLDGNTICSNCDGVYEINSHNYFDRVRLKNTLCTKLNPVEQSKIKGTETELFVLNILDEYGIDYVTNIRDIIPPKELDIYIPSKGIAIECNGVYWHSMKESSYHINKYNECKSKGIQLITIWEDWVKTKPQILKSVIVNKLGLSPNRYMARKCVVKEISSRVCNDFLDTNHIQGKSNSSVKLGLFYNDTLVSVMTFGKSRVGIGKLENGWELVRFCNLLNTCVNGGASKLLKYFIRHYNPTQIVSYSSNDISDGGLYDRLGFERTDRINKSYWYISQKDFTRYHRFKFRKSVLSDMGYDTQNLTESQIMDKLPYFKIYDCGTTRWVLLFNEK